MALLDEDGMLAAVHPGNGGEHFDPAADLLDPGRPDEHCAQRLRESPDREVRFMGVDLSTERVALDHDVEHAELRLG